MQDSKNFEKKYEGLLPDEKAQLLDLERSVELEDSLPIFQKIF